MSKEVALVTGGAGFIGSHTVDLLLEKNYKVRVIDNFESGNYENLKQHLNNPMLDIEDMDIRNVLPNNNIFRDVKLVFHFAGKGEIVPSINQPLEYISVNLSGTVNVLNGVRNSNLKKFVYAASSSCYGASPKTPTNESEEIVTEYPYALSKYLGELAVLHWNKVYGLPSNSIRIFNAYGTRSRTSGAYGAVFGVFLKQKIEGYPYTVVGDGTQKRDFVYVTDVAEAFYLASQTKLSGEVWNLGYGNPVSVNDLVKLLGGEKIHIPDRPGEPKVTWANIGKIQEQLEWRPKVNIESGIEKILKNLSYWKNAPLWDPKSIDEATKEWFELMNRKNK